MTENARSMTGTVTISLHEGISGQCKDISAITKGVLLTTAHKAATRHGGTGSTQTTRKMQADINHAYVLLSHGANHLSVGEVKKARECFNMAVRILKDLNASTMERCRCINEIGMHMYKHGFMQEAMESFDKAYRILGKEEPESLLYAEVMSNVGSMLLRDDDKIDAALELLEKSLEVVRKLTPNSMELAGGYNNYASMLNERGMFERALHFHRLALEIHERRASSDALSLASSLQVIGKALKRKDEKVTQDVLEFYVKGCAVLEERAKCSLVLATSLNGIATVLDERGQLDEAVLLRQRANVAQTNAGLPTEANLHHYIPP